ncbi:MAG: VCBS repeat-containing protein [Planctomycetales bacterium]|nr:VCBS repeat-containing protein [Planctomycetales bacterium]
MEFRQLLTAVPLSEQILIDSIDAFGAAAIDVADIDGDNKLDVVVGSYLDNRVAWYKNNGDGDFDHRIVTEDGAEPRDVLATDLDGDGDFDILVAAYGGDRVEWYENLDGKGNFSFEANIVSVEARGVWSVDVGDFNEDGRPDIVSGSSLDDKIAWYQNLGSGAFSDQKLITTDTDEPRDVVSADIDNDGHLDVVTVSRSDDTISWFPGDGTGEFGLQELLPSNASQPESVAVADLDGDSDLDIVAAIFGDAQIVWHENDGTGEFTNAKILSDGTLRGLSVDTVDLDGDGDQDIIAGSYFNSDTFESKVAWFENTDGKATFGREQFLAFNTTHGVQAVIAADLDGDGDPDVLSASQIDNKVAWYENDGSARFGRQMQIASDAGGLAEIDVADIDGDGDQDILAGSNSDSDVTWYENIGNGDFSNEKLITSDTRNLQSVALADLDGDGAPDALSASYDDDKIAWYKNDGQGNFGSQLVITTRANGAIKVDTADVDGDGDQDVLVAASLDSSVGWHENLDGLGTFGPYVRLPGFALAAEWITSGDLDGDGDLDLMSAAYGDGKIRWYENVDGNGDFATGIVIHEGAGANTVEPIDVDGDGDLDIAVTLYGANDLLWYENTDGKGTFGASQIVTTSIGRSEILYIADFDGNGRDDIIAAARDEVLWFEFDDATRDWTRHSITLDVGGVFDLHVVDLDGDGDNDVLSASAYDSKLAWYRNDTSTGSNGDVTGDGNVDVDDIDRLCRARLDGETDVIFDLNGDGIVSIDDTTHLVKNILNTGFGDANLDGIFNSTDFVTVFRAGEYEDAIVGNSTWSEGDWNCDGEFTTRDLVTAFTGGSYVANARAHDFSAWRDDVKIRNVDAAENHVQPAFDKHDSKLAKRAAAIDQVFRSSVFVP